MEPTAKEQEGEESGVEDHWYLVDAHGQKFRLPKTMLFLGREECDVVVASQSVDKRHAVLTFDIYLNRFKVKDLSTSNGTYVNNQPIQEQEYVTLNHMDSVRLGNDTMMYHIEQGSQITSQGGHLPDHRVIPSWATRRSHDAPAIHLHTHAMAECQLHYIGLYGWFPTLGCIAEQSIEHSCGLQCTDKPSSTDGVHVNDPNHCMYSGNNQLPSNQNINYNQQPPHLPQCHVCQHQHHQQYQQNPGHHHNLQPQPTQQQHNQQQSYSLSSSESQPGQVHSVTGLKPGDYHHQHHHHQQLQLQHHHQQQEQPDHKQESHTQENTSRNSLKGDQNDAGENLENEIIENSNVGQGRNTWPRKRPRQAPHVATLFGTSETSDDGSNPNGSEAKPGGPNTGMYFVSFDDSVCNGSTSDLTTVNAQRITRNSSKSPFSKDLTTVKKGTPLYGQPDWWGESEQVDGGDNGHSTNPNSAKQDHENVSHSTDKDTRPSSLVLGTEDSQRDHQQNQSKPAVMVSRGSAYMEIPVHGGGDGNSPSDNVTTPDGKSGAFPTSISNDSLFSPESKQPPKPNLQDISPSAEKNPAMSFTIDLDDHPPRKINIGSSLSQFVPTKIRKNFLERKDKTVTVKGSSTESTPSKNSEERDVSPNNQRKIEEIWSSLEGKGKPSQLSSVQATAGSSLRSPNLEDLGRLSELSDDRQSSEKEGEKKGKKPIASKGSPKLSRVKVGSVKPVASVSLSQYSDATTYLIDKMFEGGPVSASSSSSEKEMSPEQKLYREAAGHDKPKTLSSSSSKFDSKPPRSLRVHSSGNNENTKNKKVASSLSIKSDIKSNKTVRENGKVDDEDLKIVESVGCDDKEDKASEAGTYTIEADEKEAVEEEQARSRIDEVFGVEGEVLGSALWRPIIDPVFRSNASPGGYDNVRDDELDGDKTPLDEYGASLVDSLMIDDDEGVENENENDGVEKSKKEDPSATMGTEEVQTWVSQLTALASHKAANNISDSAKQAWDEASDTSVTKKPPHGLNRKRPGTGRKLPSIPTTDRSPVSSEHSSHIGEQDVSGLEDSMSFQSSDLLMPHNGKDTTANGSLSPAKSPQVSSQFSKSSSLKTAATTNGRLSESPSSSVVGGKGYKNGTNVSSPNVSARSRGSVDTELLLQDTETVMAAMEARMAHKKSNTNYRVDNSQDDSDTDMSSTVGLVNGDEAYKPTVYKSPREALSKRNQAGDASKSTGSHTTSSLPTKKSQGGKSYSAQTVSSKSHSAAASPRNTSSASFTTKKSVVSDVFSRADSFDNDSIISDVGSDAGDSTASRSSSKAKGAMSMTKPNRAFQLRRARADSTEEPTTPRLAKSAGKSSVGSARSTSLHSTSRVRSSVLDSGRSEASLGAQIVRKSRTNERTDKNKNSSSSSNLERNDGGRHSLRLQRASSLTIAPQASLTYPGKRETTPKSHLKSTYSSSNKGSLSITGVSSGNRPQSQPGSRSNSPKAAERMAWKRRKEYDPRRAVAQAKAKTKEPGSVSSASSTSSISMRSKPSTRENLKRRMIRSASFGNSVNLTAHGLDSLSNSHSLGLSERRDHYHNDEGFRRAFMPVHGSSLRSDRSAHSADEDDTLSSVASTQMSYDNLIVSSIYQLSLKLSTSTDKTLHRLREENRVSFTPSPIDDFLSDAGKSDFPAWKSANQELAGVLKNLRKLERHVTMMNRVLFPEEDMDSDMLTGREKQKYYQEIERIRSELAGFHPIDNPRREDYEVASPEMEEFSETF